MKGKLNWLENTLPEGAVVDARWLERHGVSRQLRRKYVLGGWLVSPIRGVYTRPGRTQSSDPMRWQQLALSLQEMLETPVSVGGRTALELHGLAHYAASSMREVHLYLNGAPPGWVSRLNVDAAIIVHNATKLFNNGRLPQPRLNATTSQAEPTFGSLTQHAWGHWNWPLTVSTPERAVLEMLDEVPQRETFHQADVLMEGLRNLSPRRLQLLLIDCRSVKVKRLFLWFAKRHGHAWLDRLDRSAIDLGSGKRMLVRGGRLDPEFHITVPENLDGGL